MHLLYSLIALMLVGVVALSAANMSAQSEQRIISNEIMTQVTGVADEVFDHADGYWFDEVVNEENSPYQPPIFPLITEADLGNLTATSAPFGPSSDGWGGCTVSIYNTDSNMGQNRLQNIMWPETCDDLDDLHGLSLNLDRDGLTYTVDIAVDYVDPIVPTVTSPSQTFAKRLTLTITSQDYQVGSNPLQVQLSRIFVYNRITT